MCRPWQKRRNIGGFCAKGAMNVTRLRNRRRSISKWRHLRVTAGQRRRHGSTQIRRRQPGARPAGHWWGSRARRSEEPPAVAERRGSLARKAKPTPIAGRQAARPAGYDLAQGSRGTSIVLSVQGGVDWQTDTVIVNGDGQRIWVKDAFTGKGQRIGAGPCCLESEPCKWHRSFSQTDNGGYPPILSKHVH
jgi:hypothetical protein